MNDDEFKWNTRAENWKEYLLRQTLNGVDAVCFEGNTNKGQWFGEALDLLAGYVAHKAAILAIQCEPYELIKEKGVHDVLGIIDTAVEIAWENYHFFNPLAEYDHNDLQARVIHAAQCAAFMATQRAKAAHPEDDPAQLQLFGEDEED